jgi:hypothetical protein
MPKNNVVLMGLIPARIELIRLLVLNTATEN